MDIDWCAKQLNDKLEQIESDCIKCLPRFYFCDDDEILEEDDFYTCIEQHYHDLKILLEGK